jgi:hypothetical protein
VDTTAVHSHASNAIAAVGLLFCLPVRWCAPEPPDSLACPASALKSESACYPSPGTVAVLRVWQQGESVAKLWEVRVTFDMSMNVHKQLLDKLVR